MGKLIIIAASLGALAVPAASMAAVSYNDASVGSVSKGDVQTALGGINDDALQSAWKDGKITFTSKYQMDSIDRWNCSDGSVQQMTLRTVQAKPLNVSANTNKQGKVTTGCTLKGVNETVGGKFLYGERIGYDKMYQCPAGSYFTGFAPHVFENTVLPGVQVTYDGTTFDLPNTPVV
jgi:hypothetical protein